MKVKIENLSSKDKQSLMNYVSVFNKLTEFQKLQENCDMLTFEDANKTNFYLINDNQFINYQLKKDNEKIYLIDQINNIYIQDACAIMPKFKALSPVCVDKNGASPAKPGAVWALAILPQPSLSRGTTRLGDRAKFKPITFILSVSSQGDIK